MHPPTLESEKWSFLGSLNNDSWAYQDLAMELIFLCRFFVQAHKPSINSIIRLRKVLIAADDALKSAAEPGDSTSKEVEKKFENAIDLLSDFERDFPFKKSTFDSNIGEKDAGAAKISDESKSPSASTILYVLKRNLHAKPMGNKWSKRTRVVKFHLLRTIPDTHRRHRIVEQVLSDSPSLQEILWNFSRFRDKKQCLTLRDNPHFYVDLPTFPEAYGDRFETESIENFQHANEFYVLTDNPELRRIYIMTDQVSQSFGNVWRPKNAIIFKDICGRLRGEGIITANLRGTCGFCKQLQVTSIPGASTNHRGLQAIMTEGYPSTGWQCLTGYLPMHSSLKFALGICTGHRDLRSNGPLLVPLPPTSEKPGYSVVYRTHVYMLDNDSLLQVLIQCRLQHGENWNVRLRWLKLAHVCRRWRYLIYDSLSVLDMCLHLRNDSHSIDALSHLPPLPLVIHYSDRRRTTTVARKDEDNILLGLQQHSRVRRVILQAPSSSLRIWLEPMNKLFPILEDLSLLASTIKGMDLILPETLQAPNLYRLSLHGINLSATLPLLSSAIALSTLSLTHIGASCYFSPKHLVTQLQGLPHLEELSIGFAIPIPLPSSERELLPEPIPPVTLFTLRRLTFRGVDVYLDNLVAQINTPLLEQLSLTLLFDLTFSLANLTQFIHRTEELGCLVARVTFSEDGAFIDAGNHKQRGIGKLSLRVSCEPLDWQIDSATQVCIALGDVLSTVEELTIDLDERGMPSGWENLLDGMLWHELLLPFVGVKKLHIGSSLTLELSRALQSDSGGLFLELLPGLQELEVRVRVGRAKKGFYAFKESRESAGRPVFICITDERPSSPNIFPKRFGPNPTPSGHHPRSLRRAGAVARMRPTRSEMV